jgi:hypothetical protein
MSNMGVAVMIKLIRPALASLLLALASPWASALEMGELVTRSGLGQPFLGEIGIRGELHAHITPDCVRLVTPRQADGLPGLPASTRVEYLSGPGSGVLRLIGQEKLLEPALRVAVRIECGINQQREYTVILDLPGQAVTRSAPPPTSARPASESAPPPAAPVSRKPDGGKPPASAPRSSQKTHKPAQTRPTVAPLAHKAAPQPASPPSAPAPRPIPGERPAAEPSAAPTPTGKSEAQPASPVAPAASPTPSTGTPAPAGTTAGTDAIAPDVWITVALVSLIALLLLAIGHQYRRNVRAARAPLDTGRIEDADAFHSLRLPRESQSPKSAAPAAASAPAASAPRTVVSADDDMPAQPVTPHGEYMMDLTDVMLSFGETQRALKALHEFVHEHPDDAIAPWLRLLELLRKHDKREEFQALAIKLHQVFNVATPLWEEPKTAAAYGSAAPEPASSLEDYTHIRQHLVEHWGKPECGKYLDVLMRDNRAGQRRGFPVQIVEELILLRDILGLRLANS